MNTEDNRSRAYFWASGISKKKISNRNIAATAFVGCVWLIAALIAENLYFIAPAACFAFSAWLQFERKGFIEILEAKTDQKTE
jgi:hypothetical protein